MWSRPLLAGWLARLNRPVFAVAACLVLLGAGMAAGYFRTKSLMQTLTEVPRHRLQLRAQLAYDLPERTEAESAIRQYCNMLELEGVSYAWWVQKEKTFCLLMLATTLKQEHGSRERELLFDAALNGCPRKANNCNIEPLMRRLARLYPNSPWLKGELEMSQSTTRGERK